MGMQTPSFQQPPQPSGKGPQQYSQPSQPTGKGMAQPTGSHPVGDFGDPNYEQPDGGINGQYQPPQPSGKGNSVTFPSQGGQPRMGRPNNYSNTVGPWDNASIQPQTQSGKGKGH